MLTATRNYHKNYTSSTYYLPDGSERNFLELPWRDNAIGKSCIPEGVYKLHRDHTGRMQWYAFDNEETSPRTHIEIHPASVLRHLKGCLAPCFEIKGGARTSNPVAVDSLKACEELVKWYGEDGILLEITS